MTDPQTKKREKLRNLTGNRLSNPDAGLETQGNFFEVLKAPHSCLLQDIIVLAFIFTLSNILEKRRIN